MAPVLLTPTLGDAADQITLDRRRLGLVERHRNDDDHRLVRLALTPLGHERVNALALAHRKELRQLAEVLGALLEADADG